MKKKDGRPPRSIAAWRSLHARRELERFPEVLALIEALEQDIDPAHIEVAVANALVSLKVSRRRGRGSLLGNATVEQRQLHAADEVERLSQDRHALALLAAAVNAELQTATSELERAETVLRTVVYEREPVDRYERDVALKLRAAGLTIKAARTMNAAQVIRIRDAMDGVDEDGFALPQPSPRLQAKAVLVWRHDNPWSTMSKEVEGYRLKQHPMTETVDAAVLREAGLPPAAYLKEFGDPFLMGAFDAAIDANAKARASWDICAKWIADNIIEDFGSQDVATLRERAWTFLFGIKYGFAHKVSSLARVRFVSPWQPDHFVEARLIE